MPSIWKKLSQQRVQPYSFLSTDELIQEETEEEPETVETPAVTEEEPERQEPKPEPPKREPDVVSYAQIQANQILQDAQKRAETILAKARKEAEAHSEQVFEKARQEGFETGRAEGIEAGFQQAMVENERAREEQAAVLEADVRQFLEKAEAVLEQQLDDNVEQLRDLALAVAEKVICVSLKSSSDVIARMIQTAVDKRKRREWVHIYIAECDVKNLAQMPESLTAALSALSDRVRIVPISDDEAGTCIIEMPDEIIDASAATQMANIRTILAETPVGGQEALFQQRRD